MKYSTFRGSRLRWLSGALVIALIATLGIPEDLVAQGAALGQQRLGRPYLFVFLAYAIAWALIFGWIISIARRLRSLERKIDS